MADDSDAGDGPSAETASTAPEGAGTGEPAADRFHDVWETRVRFAETDAQGIVFYGDYVTYQDETFSQYLREIGYPWTDIESEDWDLHVVHVDLDYRAPARFGDELTCAFRTEAIRESSMEFAWRCRRTDDGSRVAEGGLTHVAVRDGDPCRVPERFREAVLAYQDVPPDPA